VALRRPAPPAGHVRAGLHGLTAAPVTVRVRLAPLLAELADGDARLEVGAGPGTTVGAVLDELAARFPAVGRRVRDEQGAVRRHVNVFVGMDNIRDLDGQDTPVGDGTEVSILPAISGGGADAARSTSISAPYGAEIDVQRCFVSVRAWRTRSGTPRGG